VDIRLWLDDEREAPIGWIRCFSAAEANALLSSGRVVEVSLDHDLGAELTGYDVAKHIAYLQHVGEPIPEILRCHSANPVGRAAIEQLFERIRSR
jgi:hypothetical protein